MTDVEGVSKLGKAILQSLKDSRLSLPLDIVPPSVIEVSEAKNMTATLLDKRDDLDQTTVIVQGFDEEIKGVEAVVADIVAKLGGLCPMCGGHINEHGKCQ
jgi:hypothetical protein